MESLSRANLVFRTSASGVHPGEFLVNISTIRSNHLENSMSFGAIRQATVLERYRRTRSLKEVVLLDYIWHVVLSISSGSLSVLDFETAALFPHVFFFCLGYFRQDVIEVAIRSVDEYGRRDASKRWVLETW